MTRFAVLAPLALAACATSMPEAPSAPDQVPGTRCDAGVVAALVGRPADAVLAEAQRLSGAATTRRYVTGAVVTQDFRADRLNVETDAAGVVVKFSCG